MPDLTPAEIEELISDVENASDEIEEAIYKLSNVAGVLASSGHTSVSERIRRYTIGNITSFTERDNWNQIGNLHKDIIPSIEELGGEDE